MENVEYQILNFLQLQHNNPTETSKIKQAVKVDNRDINRHLYKLKRDGILIKINESPPTWQLNLNRKQNIQRTAQSKQKHNSGRNYNPIYGRKVKINVPVILYNSEKFECNYKTQVDIH